MPFKVKKAVALLLGLLFLMSCGTDTDKEKDDAYYSFTDALGREVVLHRRPERTAALLGSFADMWQLAGGTLCAAPNDAFEDFDIPSEGVVNIGGAHSVSLEMLLSAEPDFVIASASTASNIELGDTLTSAGIQVAYFDVDNFEDYLTALDVLTDITYRKDLYEKNGIRIAEEIEAVKADFQKSVPYEKRKILLLRASSGGVKAKGSDGTVLGEMLSDMGCVNIADSDGSLLENLSVEAVLENEPYSIFAVTMGNDNEAARLSLEKLLIEDPLWSSMNAVKEGRVHIMDKKLFNMKPNDNWAESYRIIYEKLSEQ